ncbi:GNAT family N-acetyltransferase [Demetria terragena]|uniref:GNAT family N-acetyltransferase n=1 Tax=Demetria terragena TaxID=63959 RepID=UPI00037DE50E|nr:GNAT family N-acetyltransferase [Demetria terragena]
MTDTSGAARAALDTLPGLVWSPWTEEDLPDVSAMLTAVEAVDSPSERHSLAELQEDFASATYDLARDCLLARGSAGDVVAIARSICADGDVTARRALLAGAVRPDRRGLGIGRAIMAWQLAHARAWFTNGRTPEHELLRLRVFSDSKATAEHRLAERCGLTQARFYAELTLRLPAEPVADRHVDGIELRPWREATSVATLAVRNAAFADSWGSVETTEDRWLERQQATSFRPDWSFVAVDRETGQVVALLMSSAYEQDWEPQGFTSGYIDLLGTLRDYRGRGLASALITQAMRTFQQAGLDAAEIGVDSENESGAFGLYTSLGFEQTSGTVQFMREESST